MNQSLSDIIAHHEWYKHFFETIDYPVIVLELATGEVLIVNDCAAEILNSKKELLQSTVLPELLPIIDSLRDSEHTTIQTTIEVMRSELTPTLRTLEITAKKTPYCGVPAVQIVARDISEDKLEESQVQADKMMILGQLSAGVAHEIRNPLAAINLNLQLLKRKFPEQTIESEHLATALMGVERIARIVEATLDFSKPTPSKKRTSDINKIVSDSITFVGPLIHKKSIDVSLDLSASIPHINVDEKQIQQVLINLIANATDAIPKQGTITAKTEYVPNRSYIQIDVTDSGVGIAEHDLEKIFNPFFTRKADGTGLGLSITQRIIQQHNGLLEVHSELGKGSTFTVKLPIA